MFNSFTHSRWCSHFVASFPRLTSPQISFDQIKYDDPESAKGIPAFIEFHGLLVEEILDPLDLFSMVSSPILNSSLIFNELFFAFL